MGGQQFVGSKIPVETTEWLGRRTKTPGWKLGTGQCLWFTCRVEPIPYLGPPVVPFYPFLGRVPLLTQTTEKEEDRVALFLLLEDPGEKTPGVLGSLLRSCFYFVESGWFHFLGALAARQKSGWGGGGQKLMSGWAYLKGRPGT